MEWTKVGARLNLALISTLPSSAFVLLQECMRNNTGYCFKFYYFFFSLAMGNQKANSYEHPPVPGERVETVVHACA